MLIFANENPALAARKGSLSQMLRVYKTSLLCKIGGTFFHWGKIPHLLVKMMES